MCVGGECTCINICTSICMTVHISECTALMSPNRAKQPYMHEMWILIDLQLLPTLGFGMIGSCWPMRLFDTQHMS